MECNGIRDMACLMVPRITLRCIRATFVDSKRSEIRVLSAMDFILESVSLPLGDVLGSVEDKAGEFLPGDDGCVAPVRRQTACRRFPR